MKKFIFIMLVVGLVQNWGKIHNFMVAPPVAAQQHEEEVVLYATSWCGYCKKTREYLRANNIPYFEYDIETSVEGHRQYKALQGNGVPLLLVKNDVIRGYNPPAIKKALAGG
jgi:glutaredoxin